jgi:D-psicose/D-tagatose/L-ribulose 3-epimerase
VAHVTQDLGLDCYISAGLREHTDVTSADAETRRRGVEFLKGCVAFARQAGAPFLSGSFHSVFGKKATEPVREWQWERSAECLREVAQEAQSYNMALALEPINRYESFLVNTAAQADKLIRMIGEPNVNIQLDTFHMNLEEDDFPRTIESVGPKLLHFHVAENHRGRFGHGTIPWDSIFEALVAIRYQGAIVIETFVPEVAEVALAAAIWRRMASSPDEMAREGIGFIRRLADKYGL